MYVCIYIYICYILVISDEYAYVYTYELGGVYIYIHTYLKFEFTRGDLQCTGSSTTDHPTFLHLGFQVFEE